MNKDTAVVEKGSGEVRAFPLKNVPDVAVSRESVLSFVDMISKYAWMLALPLFILIAAFNFVGSLIVFAIAALLLLIAAKFGPRKISFKNAFNVSMHAYTALFCVDVILLFLGRGGFGLFSAIITTFLLGAFFIFKSRGNV